MFDLVQALKDAKPTREAAFEDSEHLARMARAREAMEAAGLDVLLVHNVPNISYLSGYLTQMTSWYVCLVLPRDGEPFIHVNEGETALVLIHGPVGDVVTIPWRRSSEAPEDLADVLRRRGLAEKRIGIETARYPLYVDTYLRLRKALPKADVKDASDLVSNLRVVKSAAEIAHMREAARITAVGMEAARKDLRLGNTDNDVAAAAYSAMVRAGSEHPATAPFVQAGHRIGWGPNTNWKRFPLQRGEPVLVGLTGTYYRYGAPQFRTAAIGAPSDEIKRLADAAINSVGLAIENIRPGRSVHDVAKAAGKGLRGLDRDVQFDGSFGHSVGLGLVPTWQERSLEIVEGVERPLEPGMAFHALVGLRIPGRTGVGFSETCLVTDGGCEVLTKGKREIIVEPA
ncbi:MAG: aminopeptidase P family protein [Rhodospirillales bacterium]|nr:aminopeptidase P family protein [Rhodospirillales bacterium]